MPTVATSVRRVTDEQLREDVAEGLTVRQIAERRGVSRQAVEKRLKLLQMVTSVAATIPPQEAQRFVRGTLDAFSQLTKSLERINLLMDACDTWLRDANDPERYDVGPREGEIQVTYDVELVRPDGIPYVVKRKKPLSEILADLETVDGERVCAIKKWESKHADPRELILRTTTEARQTVQSAAELARMLADAKAMETFREALLLEVSKASPEIARNVAEAVRRSVIFSQALGGTLAVPASPGSGE